MSTQNENNSGLYFVVGALVVAVAIMGFILFANDGEMDDIQPAAGIEKAADNVKESTESFSLEMNEDGVSATSTETE